MDEIEAKEEALDEMGFEINPLEDPMETLEEKVTTSETFETEVIGTKKKKEISKTTELSEAYG